MLIKQMIAKSNGINLGSGDVDGEVVANAVAIQDRNNAFTTYASHISTTLGKESINKEDIDFQMLPHTKKTAKEAENKLSNVVKPMWTRMKEIQKNILLI